MELNRDHLRVLERKTWDLDDRNNEEIEMSGIGDSLKDVHSTLIWLQGMKSRQSKKRDEALARVEESRKSLIDRINEFPEKGRRSEVLEELIITFVKDGKIEFPRGVKNGFSRFVGSTIRFGLEFVVVFASIYAGVRLCEDKQKKSVGLEKQKDVFVLVPMEYRDHLDVLCGRG